MEWQTLPSRDSSDILIEPNRLPSPCRDCALSVRALHVTRRPLTWVGLVGDMLRDWRLLVDVSRSSGPSKEGTEPLRGHQQRRKEE